MPPAGEGDSGPPPAVEAGEETPEVTREAAPDKSAETAATNIDTANNTAEMADGAGATEQKQEPAPEPAEAETIAQEIVETIAQEIVDTKPLAEVEVSDSNPDAQDKTEDIAQENTKQPAADTEAREPTASVEVPQQADFEAAGEAAVLLLNNIAETVAETVQPAEESVRDNATEHIPAEQEATKEPKVPEAETMEDISEQGPTVSLGPAVKQEDSELALTKEATKLMVAEDDSEPSVPKDTSVPAVPKEASALAAAEEASEPTVPKEATELAVPEEASEPAVSKDALELAVPKEASELRVPQEASELAVHKEASEQVVKKNTSELMVSKDTLEPVVKHEALEHLGQTEASESENSKTSAEPVSTNKAEGLVKTTKETPEAAMVPQPAEVTVEETSPVKLPPGDGPKVEETGADKAEPVTVAVAEAVKSVDVEKVTSPSPASTVDHDYEDVTPLASVADYDDVTLLQTVTEEVVVAAIQSLAEVPEAGPGDKAADCPPVASPRNKRDSFVEIKEEIVDDLEFIKAKLATPPAAPAKAKRASKEVKEIIEVKEVAKEAQAKEVKEAGGAEPPVAPEVFSRECIPPVRPERSRTVRRTSRLVVPDWTPPKQTIFGYIFGCFRPHKH